MSLDDHAEEIASDLGVDKTEVKADLENLVSYSVPMEEAKQSLRRKYGEGGSDAGSPTTPKDIAAVRVGDESVSVTAVVLTVGKRSIRYQGEDHVILEGQVADETGTISYTAWEPFDIEPGQTVRIENAGIREWEGNPELNLGERTTVDPADETLEVPYEIGGDRTLTELAVGDRGVNLDVVIESVERKTIDGRDGETDILSGVVADETTRLPFTDWDPHEPIKTDETVRIENTFVREFRGVPSVNISEFSMVEPLDRRIEPAETAAELTVKAAVDSGGRFDVAVVGDVLSVRDGSGLVERCPECNRIVQNGQCRSHGDVDGVDDLRVKAILDDGTETLTVVLGRDLTAEIYGGDVEDAKAHARDAMDKDVVADRIRSAIVGRKFRARGSLSVDDFGANLEAESFEPVESDPVERASSLLGEVEG